MWFCWRVGLLLVFSLFVWLPRVSRFFANHCKSSSHTRESLTNKAPCSIGYGAKKIWILLVGCVCVVLVCLELVWPQQKDKMASLNFIVEAHRDQRTLDAISMSF